MSATNWEDAYRVQTARIAELERENAELRATLDAIISADERAVKLWRAAHPGNELNIPDRAKLVGWLLEQNAAAGQDCTTGALPEPKAMSQVPHPKAEIIKQALLEMRPLKEISDVADCRERDVHRQIETLGLRRIYLTRAERELIATRRGLDLKFVP